MVPEVNVESVQVCEPATKYIVEGILVEFVVGINWSPAHTPIAEVHTQSLVIEKLFCGELDEEMFALL